MASMPELFSASLEAALGDHVQDKKIQEVLVESDEIRCQAEKGEEITQKDHLRLLKARRDRDIRNYLRSLRAQNAETAEAMYIIEHLPNRNVQAHSTADFMKQLADTDPEFRAIFTHYDHLRTYVKAGMYTPAKIPEKD